MRGEPSDLPGPWPDILAAFVDGELKGEDRAAVERWLAAHPHAREELRVQWELSPENWRLWQRAEPPLPDEETWAASQDAVADAVTRADMKSAPAHPAAQGRGKKRSVLLLAGAVAIAASVLVALVLADRWGPVPADPSQPKQIVATPEPAEDPLAGIEVLAMAGDEDVVIDRVAGDTAECLPVGQLPLAGPIVLATVEEVALEGADEHPAWPEGGLRLSGGPGDAPMIFAANPR